MSTYNKVNIIGGGFQDSSGNPLSNGFLTFDLTHDGNICTLGAPTGVQVTSGQTTKYTLNVVGNLNPNQYIWSNDLLTPSGSYYSVIAYDRNGIQVWGSPQKFILTYSVTLDLGTVTPLVP